MRTLTINIDEKECVGDSLAKHNYNALVLDTTVCNLSSMIYNDTNNILSWFNDISANSEAFNLMAQNFSDESVKKYKIADTTISLLSSYWNTSEFTVQYEHNIYIDDTKYGGTNITYYPLNGYTITTPLTALINSSKKYLTTYFPASNFITNTRANVVVFLQNILNASDISSTYYTNIANVKTVASSPSYIFNSIDDYNGSTPGYQVAGTPYNTGWYLSDAGTLVSYPTYNKTMIAEFVKQSIYIGNVCTIKYTNGLNPSNNKYEWAVTNIIVSDPNLPPIDISKAVNNFLHR